MATKLAPPKNQILQCNDFWIPVAGIGPDGQPQSLGQSIQSARSTQGKLFPVPDDDANGAEIGTQPDVTSGISFYVPDDGFVQWFIDEPGQVFDAPPDNTVTSGADGRLGQRYDERLAPGDQIYIVSSSGNVLARWIQA